MLDMKFIREHAEEVKENLVNRHNPFDLDHVLDLDQKRRELLQQTEVLKSQKNAASKMIAQAKKEGRDASKDIEDMREVGKKISAIDSELASIEAELKELLLHIPNMADKSVPVGKDDSENPEVRRWGEIPTFDFPVKAHYELGDTLGILDSERAGKVSGARFYFYLDGAARLERAVYNFMLDVHTQENDFIEVIPPYIINGNSMQGTGQLPKFADDMYKVEGEMVKYCKPEDSWDELESLTKEAEKILQLLKLPYHVVCLCTGDIGFSSAKTYDIEVWMPAQNKYREISSCSNCLDFQARRANIRFRRKTGEKPEFVHTLNGSGLAVGRTVVAIMENYQQADGTIRVPDALVPYMNGVKVIGQRKNSGK